MIAPLALGYFAGIAYLDAFLSAFSISIHEVDAPLATIVAHSYNVFIHNAFLAKLTLTGVGALGLALGFAWLRKTETIPKDTPFRAFILCVLPVVAFILFISVKASAEETARTTAHRIWHEQGAVTSPRNSFAITDNALSVRQRLRLSTCLQGAVIKHVIAIPERSYALCVIGKEGFLLTHVTASDRYLPIRNMSPCAAANWQETTFCASDR
ncbi:hypothetical protein [Stappia stellulata]|uniref:hypothetical protein n=1 Tax=Stappia stellulata TaxID=71235 RepID=UPI0004041DA3|nr:hypothetical protein [Stappia stellulata]